MTAPFGLPWEVVGSALVIGTTATVLTAIQVFWRLPGEWRKRLSHLPVYVFAFGMVGAFGFGLGGTIGMVASTALGLPTAGDTLAEEVAQSGTRLMVGAGFTGTVLAWVLLVWNEWIAGGGEPENESEVTA